MNEHYDFFHALWHPFANQMLKDLTVQHKTSMQFWQYAVFAFLNVLWHQLPKSQEYMLAFIKSAHNMMMMLLKKFNKFDYI